MNDICLEHNDLEDKIHSSTSLKNCDSHFDLPSLENSTMAHLLVQQQAHQKTSTQNETLVSMDHTVDEGLFFYKQDSTSLLHFLQKFASEPQISMYHSSSQKFLDTNSIPFPISNTFLSSNEPKEEEDEVDRLNSDQIEPIIIEDKICDTLDNISASVMTDDSNEDSILSVNSLLNSERHFRRRKRRTSLTRQSSSNDEPEVIKIDSIEPIDNNQEKELDDIAENLQRISIENISSDENNEIKEDISVENGESSDKTTPSRFRTRRLRSRIYHQPSSTSEESTIDNSVNFFVPTETTISPPPSTPPSSPTSATPNLSVSNSNLKRTSSIGTTKKMVRFADSVGRQLAQVQYIQSLTDDDTTDFSLLKNNLYIPKSLNLEHKPWSFDVALTSKQVPDIRIPKRFFCLYRQPNSEHPDIYLHEIWKSQVKLEHAGMRLKSSITGEQFLYGTLWVTNSGYYKNVTIKYTFNHWLNVCEYEAQHCCHSNDFRNTDQFEFRIDFPHDVDRIDFVIRYRVNGQEHWDNNEGKNYTLETETAYTPQTTISLPHDCNFNEMRFY
ncbi:unnamed protein product [Rotaria sp. Silwood2]|nr:unnamed protein product [Rotaria sp. Silwood2]CAF3002821.1 unnamed protein product [Rotaria sp. Silwood2]CAF3302363.1 unnamed protein product [Rotaria sp. Silwood2]CAF3376576.1 unnamed protein product [Rotaria sp. Silwood2]CAF4038898.1 unnamed protein product [Rotaria sp. Silwood2]